ncbi:MAG: Plug domain-containing protein, partial [Bacteroidales bacterium]|nr:Plug domain-containing protein [Bacteroidales bacterium]
MLTRPAMFRSTINIRLFFRFVRFVNICLCVLSGAGALFLPAFSQAQQLSPYAFDDTAVACQIQLHAVVITGTRTPKILKDVPVVTRVISSKEIEKTGALDIADVLQTEIPGVEFSRQMDGQVVMNMQGMGGSDVLFLIDGERMAGESLNNIDYERLNTDNIERVEIVRGAGS